MTEVRIAEDFYGREEGADPLYAGRQAGDITGQTKAAESQEHPSVNQEATDETMDIETMAALRAKHILEGVRYSMDKHPPAKVLEHQDEDIRLKIKNSRNELTV